MRLAQAIRQPALLRSEAVLLPALPTENVRAALSQVRSKDKNLRIDDSTFRPVEPAVAVSVRTGRQVPTPSNAAGTMVGRGILQQVGAPYGNNVPNIHQNVFYRGSNSALVGPTQKHSVMMGSGTASNTDTAGV